MPPSDYRHHAEVIGVAPFVWMRVKAFWSRIRHREGVEGHRVL